MVKEVLVRSVRNGSFPMARWMFFEMAQKLVWNYEHARWSRFEVIALEPKIGAWNSRAADYPACE